MKMRMSPENAALVLAAHGDRGGALERGDANASLLAHRDAISARGVARIVTAGVLKGDPAIEDALAEAHRSGAGHIFVYPMFMADGYFVRSVLRTRVEALGLNTAIQILPPLGLDPGLIAIVMSDADEAAGRAGFASAASRLLIVGHGSQLGPASRNATQTTVDRLRAAAAYADVAAAYLEEAPFIADALTASERPTIVTGFFSGDGQHASEDVPKAIQTTGANAIYAGSIGLSPAVPALILSAFQAALES